MTKYHVPKNEQMMDELYAWMSLDDGGEGIVSIMIGGTAITTISDKYDVEENKLYTFTCDFICEGKDMIRLIQVGVTEKDKNNV